MAKIAVFIKGHPDIEIETEARAAMALAWEKAFGLEKELCERQLLEQGAFVSEMVKPSSKFIKALKEAGMEDWAIRNGRFSETSYLLIYEGIADVLEDNRDEIEGEIDEEMIDRAIAYVRKEMRNEKIGKLL